jgi:hypothetical protein
MKLNRKKSPPAQKIGNEKICVHSFFRKSDASETITVWHLPLLLTNGLLARIAQLVASKGLQHHVL